MTERFVKCSIPECNENAHSDGRGARGYCRKHAHRLRRYGDPLAGGTAHGEAAKFLVDVVFNASGDECLIWPYARDSDGYGHLLFEGRTKFAHRLACEHRHGAAPTPEHQAAHSCGKGHEGCVNPSHVRWATPAENSADKEMHGTKLVGSQLPWAKLTEADIRMIRSLRGTHPREIAADFNVSRTTIDGILNGKRWRHVA